MEKIALYFALSFAALSPATAAIATPPPTDVAPPKKEQPAPAKVSPQEMKRASYTKRLKAASINNLIAVILGVIVACTYSASGVEFSKDKGTENFFTIFIAILVFQVTSIALELYPKSGGLGKYLLGVKLVDEKGADANYGRLALRAVIKYLPWSLIPVIGLQLETIDSGFLTVQVGFAICMINYLASLITMFTGRFHWNIWARLLVVEDEKARA